MAADQRNSFTDLADDDRDIVLGALYALQHAAGYLSAIDVSNAEANLADVRYRPLTQICIDAATKLHERVGEAFGEPGIENVGLMLG